MAKLREQPPPWVTRYVGLEFADRGRTRDGVDCWGLIRLVYAERFGVALPELGYRSVDEIAGVAREVVQARGGDSPWAPVSLDEAEFGDVVLVRLIDRWHVALLVARGLVLHAQRGTRSCLQRLDGPVWARRLGGVYRFRGPVRVTGVLRPLGGPRFATSVPAGVTVAGALEAAGVPGSPSLRVYLAGREIPRAEWHRVRPRPGRLMTVAAVPEQGKDALRIVATIAIVAAAAAVPGAGVLAGTVLEAGTFGGAVLSAGIAIGGTLALNALIPPPKPRLSSGLEGLGSSPTITGARNELRPYATVPRVLGEHRIAPPFAATPYTEISGDDQYLRVLCDCGPGPLELTDFKVGDTPLEEYEGVELETRPGTLGDDPIRIYPSAVIEESLSVLLEEAAGWTLRTTDSAAEEISIDIAFPQGLAWIQQDGSRVESTVSIDVEYSPAGADAWVRINNASPDFSRGLDFLFRTPEAQFGGSGAHQAAVEWGLGFAGAKPAYLPADYFSWEATGYVYAETAGEYVFGIDCSDAGDVAIDGAIVASWYGTHGTAGAGSPDYAAHAGSATLSRGWHQLRVRVESRSTSGALALGWKRPGEGVFSTIPLASLAQYLGRGSVGQPGLRYRWFTTDAYQSSFVVTAARAEPFRRSLAWPVPKGQYDVRVRRVTPDIDDPAVLDETYLAAIRTIRTSQAPVRVKGHALVAVRIKATDQLNGVLDQLNCIARSVFPDWDAASSAWVERGTSNPASIYRGIMQGRGNARPLADSRLDLVELQKWHVSCAANGLEFNAVYDTPGTVFERLGDVCAAGRAAWGMRDGLFSVVRDVRQTVPVQHFTPRNSRGFRWRKSWPRVPHGLRVRWLSEEAGYELDENIVLADGYSYPDRDGIPRDAFGNETTLPEATEFEVLEFFGVTSWAQAWKAGRYYLANAKLRPDVYELGCDFEHLACTRGDLVLVTHDVALIGSASGRIVRRRLDSASNVLGVDVDEECPMEAGRDYRLRVRLEDGTTWVRSVVTAPGASTSLTFSQPIAAGEPAPGARDLFMFGEVGLETRELIVKSIQMDEDLAARLELVDHAPAVHQADQGTIPDYDPGITRPPTYRDRPDRPIIESIRSDDYVMVRGTDGTLRPRMLITLRRPSGTRPIPTHAELRIRATAGPGVPGVGSWRHLPPTRMDANTISVLDVEEGVTYDIRLRTITPAGLCSLWADAHHTVVGKVRPPPDLVSFALARLSDGTRRHSWSHGAPGTYPPDVAGVQIRYGDAGSSWTNMTPIHAGVLSSSPAELNEPPEGTWRVGAKAIDTSGNESVNMRFIETTLGPPRLEGVLASEDAGLLGWPGTKTDCHVAGLVPEAVLEANDPTSWDQLAGSGSPTWDTYTRWNVSPRSPIVYEHTPLDVGIEVEFSPDAIAGGDGALFVQVAWSSNGVDYSAWAEISTVRDVAVRARYLKARVTCSADTPHPVPVIARLRVMARAETRVHEIQGLDTSTLGGGINGPGDVFLPLPAGLMSLVRTVSVSLRATGPGWTWELVEKNAVTGPRIRIYNAEGEGAHATIDAIIRGV